MFLKFAYHQLFYILVPILMLVLIYRLKFYRGPIYKFPPASSIKKTKSFKNPIHKYILFGLRALVLMGLIFLIARPQWVDPHSKINVDGIDIIIALDVSGSMNVFDDLRDTRSRLEVAKEEAIRFIERRANDPIGIVLFGGDVISRCPLTLDKRILKDTVSDLKLGFIDPDATLLGSGLASAINRLRSSQSTSKVIIILTDGVPSTDKVSPDIAIELAKKFGVKIYTVGIGSDEGGFIRDNFGRILKVNTALDMNLLHKIANETNGKSFRASNPTDMRTIYDTIDRLETTNLETNVFNNYHEAYEKFLWILLIIFGLELCLRIFKWRGIS